MIAKPKHVIPETSKKPGVCYAFSPGGVELPVVDVTHPDFALAPTEREIAKRLEMFLEAERKRERIPAFLMRIILRVALRNSILAPSLRDARGSFLSGMATYLLKLGPNHLGLGYAAPIDRRIAASLPAFMVRLRLQDTAQLIAQALAPALEASPGLPVHLINIAGGPAADSLNALLILGKDKPRTLANREIRIHVLDLMPEAPAFGASALAALRAPGAPLHEVNVDLAHVPYDWRDTRVLRDLVETLKAENGIVVASSEGGLFEYGSDDEIVANLRALSPLRCAVAGSVTRADKPAMTSRRDSGAALVPRGLPAFRELAGRAGWVIDRAIERIFSDQVLLRVAD